jgi:hypothetical protein
MTVQSVHAQSVSKVRQGSGSKGGNWQWKLEVVVVLCWDLMLSGWSFAIWFVGGWKTEQTMVVEVGRSSC